ncbi:hypothetical protein GH714_011567 [Hevea brasiliensis]|uniref:Cytochrome P450 n=1 Tax=Hevea brasiliensis TaxID=3981 RepID=A0A6A6MMH3_HEVBR|nr:hypothetical protein GH714_011567 [Hevea brasiliensis]
MELTFPTIPAICAFLLLLFMLTLLLKKKVNNNSTLKLPPGPWKLPFVGNIHCLLGSLPHHKLADLAKKYGPLMHLQLGEVSVVVVSSAEAAEELWRQLRKICTVELLSPKRVQSFRSIREEEVSNFIKTISQTGKSPINLSEKLFLITNSIIQRAAVGKKCRDQEELVSAVERFISLSSGFAIADLYPSIKVFQQMSGLRSKLEKVHRQVDRIIENIIREQKSQATASQVGSGNEVEDLIHVLLKLQEQGNLEFALSDASLKAIILDVFAAGTETSSSTLEWAMSELLKNPKLMKEAQAEVRRVFDPKGTVDETRINELKFLKSVIKETLRLHPPLSLIARECGTSCVINGYHIPAKTKVLINTWAIGRDPKYWIQAEEFHPERFINSSIDYKGIDFEYLPFGSGRRICPGISMGLANVELPLAQLLYHFDWKLASGLKPEELDMTEANGLTIRKKENLYLLPIPYHPLSVE